MGIENRLDIDKRYIDVNLTRSIIIYCMLVPYCVYLCVDCFNEGNRMIGLLALFCAVMTAIATVLLSICRFGKKPRKSLMHIAITIQCFVYWFTFGVFLYTGGTGGTSIFLIFAAAPVCFFFFNLFYGCIFCFVLWAGMVIYMQSPLHLLGYQFPEMYYKRLPMMYLIEVIMCAIAQYEADKARIKQDAALEEARHASEAKTDFLANTSHEIRTPINAVLGMNEMILRETARAEKNTEGDPAAYRKSFRRIKNYAGNVDSAGNSLLTIINDILDFSKIEEGKMEIVDVAYQLSSVLNDVSNMILFKAKDKDLEFITDVDGSIPDNLRGDAVRVRQIITNLLTNAVKYTDEGSITLKVRSRGTVGDLDGNKTTTLVFTISDTGIGIKDEDVKKLFAKFERVDLTKNSTIEGTGLGLAITKNLLDMMGGSISVESIYGEGSTFTVTLPQKVTSDEAIGDFKEKFEKHIAARKTYHAAFRAPDARILIVDDTKMNLLVATEFLKETLIRIDTAGSGAEAVHTAAGTAYDIILMDQRMPGMDGVEAMKRIKEKDDGPNLKTPVICLTADAVIGARERYLAKGFTDYLTKPIDSSSLEAMLKKYLPSEKVKEIEAVSGGDILPEEDASDDRLNVLSDAGIDTAKGLHNCGGDESFYITILAEYVRSTPEKIKKLGEYLDAKDMENYGILIHSLKSSSRTIGATDLGEAAFKLEKAAKSGEIETVSDGHDGVVANLRSLVDVIKPLVSDENSEAAESGSSDSSDVFEFAPD